MQEQLDTLPAMLTALPEGEGEMEKLATNKMRKKQTS